VRASGKAKDVLLDGTIRQLTESGGGEISFVGIRLVKSSDFVQEG
jgi:hypothetical protein